LSPAEFVKKILIDRLQVKFISVGADFRFGNQRAGGTGELQALASQHQIASYIVPLALNAEQRVSSSQIRAALLAGDLTTTKDLLGRNYTIVGIVGKGQQIGRSIGFPTANIQYPPDKFLPRQGVYFVVVDTPTIKGLPGVMNIGKRPTVDGSKMAAEVHLLTWQGDLYGQNLAIELQQFCRSEQKFSSLDALTAQIEADCTAAREFFQISRV
jgi:riboflavin kinase / FMN adenylyltransferase